MARVMKDSGIEWIGEIPDTWDTIKFKYLFSITGGNGFPESIQGQTEGTYPFCKVSDINGHSDYVSTAANYVTDEVVETHSFNIIPCGSIIIAKIGAALQKNHRKINSVPCCIDDNTQALVPVRADNIRYLFYLTHCIDMGWFDNNSTVPSLNNNKLLNFFVPNVDVAEQHRIADFLDRKCAEIDAVIEKTKATIEEYKKLKQSVITEAVTKGIRGNRPMKDSGIEWIGEIPEEWDLVQIKHLKSTAANAFVDGPFGSNLKSIHYVDNGDVYVVESGFITTGKFVLKKFKTISAEHFETIKRSECKGNDIIIAKIGANFGMAAELPQLDKPSVVSGNSLKITLNQEKILNSIFVYELGIAKAHGGYVGLYNETAQPALSLSALNSFKLVIAPIAEQKEITAYLDEKCASLDNLIAKKTALLTELETYKKSLIYEYVTGKKEV